MKSVICMIIYIIIHEKGKINFLLFYFLARYMRIEKCKGKEKVVRYLRKVILASHGELSKGMLNSVRMIIGEFGCPVETFSLYPGESALDYASELERKANDDLDTEYVVIADVLGGSVHTALMQTLKSKNIKLFSGMNMSLVLEVIMSQEEIIDNKVAERLKKAALDGITFMDENGIEEQESEEF